MSPWQKLACAVVFVALAVLFFMSLDDSVQKRTARIGCQDSCMIANDYRLAKCKALCRKKWKAQ